MTLIILGQRLSQMRGHWLRSFEEKFCRRRKYATTDENVKCNSSGTAMKHLHAQIQLVGVAPDAHEATTTYILDPPLHSWVIPRHLCPHIR